MATKLNWHLVCIYAKTSNVARHIQGKLNQLMQDLPEGLLVDAAWLEKRGYSRALRGHYVSAGWLALVAPRVYWRRPASLTNAEPTITWQQVVVSLQLMLRSQLVVGGRTALDLQGFAHYLSHRQHTVHLYGPKPPPAWVSLLPVDTVFRYHNSVKLFRHSAELKASGAVGYDTSPGHLDAQLQWLASGHREWSLAVCRPERAILEFLDALPTQESFEHADKIMRSEEHTSELQSH